MQTTGNQIKLIRLQKNQAVDYLAKNIFYPTAYAQYEMGKTETTIKNFTALLGRLNITHDEYQWSLPNQNSHWLTLTVQIKTSIQKGDITELERLLSLVNQLKDSAQEVKYLHLSVVIKKRIYEIKNTAFPNPFLSNIAQYLSMTKVWTSYEKFLYSETFEYFDVQDQDQYYQKVVTSPYQLTTALFTDYDGIELIANLFRYAYLQSGLNAAKPFLSRLKEAQYPQAEMNQKILIQILEGLYFKNDERKKNHHLKLSKNLHFLNLKETFQIYLSLY